MTARKSLCLVGLILINFLALIMMMLRPEDVLVLLCMIIWLDIASYCLLNIKKRVFLLAFLSAFFLFLMGREICDTFDLHTIVTDFPEEVDTHAVRLLIISLVSLFIGYVVSDRITFKVGNANRAGHDCLYYESRKMRVYRRTCLWIFYASMVFSAIALMHIGLFILRHGYYATYTSYTGVPWIIDKLSDLTPIAFFLFLATMPPKKQVEKHCVAFIFYLAMTLMTGKRAYFVAGLLTFMAYYINRNAVNSGNRRWITKKTVVLLAAAVPALFMFLYIFGSARYMEDSGGLSVKDALTDFIYGQGVSIHVIKFSYKNEYNPDRLYLFSSTMTFLQKNIISRLLGVKSYSGNTIENALYGYSLGHANSYYVYGARYLTGKGTGSCYIAEAFHDFGYWGVVGVNLIYGVILNRFFKFERMGVARCAISLILLQSLFLAPRGSADGFVADIVDVTTWSVFIIVFAISGMILKQQTRPANTGGSPDSSGQFGT